MEVFSEISLLLVLATIVSLIMSKLKQPLIIGHIITGLIIGPSILNLTPNVEALELFSKFGIVLLLFVVGLGLNPRVIKEVGKVSLIAGMGQIILTTLVGFGLVFLLGFNTISSLYIAVALTFSSTIIILKLLSDKKEQNKLYGKISMGLLLVQDIVATFALIVASAAGEGELSFYGMLFLMIKLMLLATAVYLFSKYVVRKINKFIAKSTEMLFVFSISWGLGVATLTYISGFSIEAGALYAGVMLASMPYAQEIASRLKPLRDFFIVIFFVSLGSSLNIAGMSEVIIPALLLSIFVLIGKPLIVNVLMGLLGYTKKTSFKTGLTVAQVSEFSIIFVLLGNHSGQISDSIVYLVTLVALITIALSTYMIMYSNGIYNNLSKYLKFFKDKEGHHERESHPNYSAVIFGYKKGGHEFLMLFKELKKKYIIVDYDPETIETLERNNIVHLYGDAQDSELMEEIGIDKAKIVISCITEFNVSMFLVKHLQRNNPDAISVVYAETLSQMEALYEEGASYVTMPYYVGSEKISSFIRRSGFDRKEFDKMRARHLAKIKDQLV